MVQADTGWEGEIEIVSDRLSGGEFLLHAPCWNLSGVGQVGSFV